jgi:hypothetical protein
LAKTVTAHFDHLAHAVRTLDPAASRYAAEIDGALTAEGIDEGFAWRQLSLDAGVLEIIAPHPGNDHLDRFLARSGEGVHHATFIVDSAAAVIESAEDLGIGIKQVRKDTPYGTWLALDVSATGGLYIHVGEKRPHDTARAIDSSKESSLVVATHAVPKMADALRVYVDLLGAVVTGTGDDGTARWCDLTFLSGPRLRIAEPAVPHVGPVSTWIVGRPGRFHSLVIRCDDPSRVGGARRVGAAAPWTVDEMKADTWMLPPEQNHGLGLVLQAR